MTTLTTIGDQESEARWVGIWDAHDLGVLGTTWTPSRNCCKEGHADPLGAIAHAAALEQAALLRAVERLPEGTWGRMILDARDHADEETG